MNIKENIRWAILRPGTNSESYLDIVAFDTEPRSGFIFRYTRQMREFRICHNGTQGDAYYYNHWRRLKRAGYKCIKVKVNEMESK